MIADPERAVQAAALGALHTFVLGGGGGPRDLGLELTTDMEQIDPRNVRLPKWYRANPGRAGDLAFVTLHRPRRGNPDEPDHEPPLGHVGLRDRIVGGAVGRRHRLQRDAAVSPVRA